MRDVDYLIVGAGIAGMTVHRFLGDADVVVLDHHPDRYKIGESIIPSHFFAPELRPLLEEARALPSASSKLGTLFATEDGVSYFHAYYDAQFTIHLDRQELEALYRRHLGVPIVRERVLEVDVERRVVKTAEQTYRVRRQIFDCSGPAMVVARALGIAHELWPVWATWAYFDVPRTDDHRFWTSLSESGRDFYRFDDATQRLVHGAIDESLRTTEMTLLTQVREGVWTWQIPLHHASRLSFGVVSRHGPIDEEEYLAITERAVGAQYDVTLRPWDRSSPHNQLHRRNRFAWAAGAFAGPSWALVGDAAFFGDPVYSIGTGLATSQAIRLASLVRRHSWEDGAWKMYDRQTHDLFERARNAYQHWYAGEVTTKDAVAREIQSAFLNGLAFHGRTGELYLDMCRTMAPEDDSDPCFTGDPGEDITDVLPAPFSTAAGWSVTRATAKDATLELVWQHAESAPLTMIVAVAIEGQRAYAQVGPFALSYRALEHGLDEHGRALFQALGRTLESHERAMLSLLALRERR
jgi:flavin-dependent dehydrogenase